MNIIFGDSETTGLPQKNKPLSEQPRIIEWAMIKLDEDLNEVDTFNELIDPLMPIDEGASKVNGIWDKDVKGKPTFEELYPRMKTFTEDCEVIWFHNAGFDKRLFQFELARIGKQMDFTTLIYKCTLELSRQVHPHMVNHKLVTLHKELCNPVTEQTHRALDDVRLTIDVYKELIK